MISQNIPLSLIIFYSAIAFLAILLLFITKCTCRSNRVHRLVSKSGADEQVKSKPFKNETLNVDDIELMKVNNRINQLKMEIKSNEVKKAVVIPNNEPSSLS